MQQAATANFTLNDQFRKQRACDERVDGGNVRRASACVDVEEVSTPREDFTFFMVRTCCEKHEDMHSEDSPAGTNVNHWTLHIFIEHISP